MLIEKLQLILGEIGNTTESAVTDAALEAFFREGLSEVETLTLSTRSRGALEDLFPAFISGLTTLAELRLTKQEWHDHTFDDSDMREIGNLVQLRELSISLKSAPKVTDAGINHLSALSNLESLLIEGTQITSQGLAELLANLPNLEILQLNHNQNMKPGWTAGIDKDSRLKSLTIMQSGILDDADIERLAEIWIHRDSVGLPQIEICGLSIISPQIIWDRVDKIKGRVLSDEPENPAATPHRVPTPDTPAQ